MVEFAEYGNLEESWSNQNIEHLWRYTIQAATVLEYLEKRNVIHRAVFADNFMVVAGFKVVIIIIIIINVITTVIAKLPLLLLLCWKWNQLVVQLWKRPFQTC